MKRRLLLAGCLSLWTLTVPAQTEDGIGAIALNPFIPEGSGLSSATATMLVNKMNQIATVGGMAGEGFDNRFIITAHVQDLDVAETGTVPPKTAVREAVTIYIGDGLDGTLFSSWTKELKGIGDTKEQARNAALRKLQVRDAELQRCVAEGKARIVEYYDRIAPELLNRSETEAAQGNYEEAMRILLAIPLSCSSYQTAQERIARYAIQSLEEINMQLVQNARNVWTASLDESAANQAMSYLNQVTRPSAKVSAEVERLNGEIASRMKVLSDREWKLAQKRLETEHQEKMAAIEAAASVARAYYRSRPRVVYRFYWW